MTVLDTRTLPTDLLVHAAERLTDLHERLLAKMTEINERYTDQQIRFVPGTIHTPQELEARVAWLQSQL
jgi:hypothetical protein